jgi:hypothetical protein
LIEILWRALTTLGITDSKIGPCRLVTPIINAQAEFKKPNENIFISKIFSIGLTQLVTLNFSLYFL